MSLFIASSPPLQSQPSQPSQSTHFEATTKNINNLSQLLTSLTPINDQCILAIKQEGLTFYTVYNHLINVLLIIDSSLFKSYTLLSEVELQIDISLISNAFQSITDQNTTCYILYPGIGHPLTIEFDNYLLLEKLDFSTFVQEIFMGDLSIDYSSISFELIIKSELLYYLLLDLLKIGTLELNLVISNTPTKDIRKITNYVNNQLFFISRSNIGLVKLIYPSQLIEKLLLPPSTLVSHTYNFTNFIKILPAVRISSKCKFIKDTNGVLCLQLLCNGNLVTFNLLEQLVEASLVFDDDEEYLYVKSYSDEVALDSNEVAHLRKGKENSLPMFL